LKHQVLAASFGAALITLTSLAGAADSQESWLKLGVGVFGKDEKSTYGNFEVGSRLGDHYQVRLGVNGAPFKTFAGSGFNVRHGGSDVELFGSYRADKGTPFEVGAGIDLPNTPSRTSAVFTYLGKVGLAQAKGFDLWVDGYGFIGDDPISMLGLGMAFDVARDLKLEASGGFAAAGNNSVDTSSGTPNRVGVYSFGLSYLQGKSKYSIALTDQSGWTTAMAASPTLAGSLGVRISYEVKF
jgi:hypothetical protein